MRLQTTSLILVAVTSCLCPRLAAADDNFARTTIDLGMIVSDIDRSVANCSSLPWQEKNIGGSRSGVNQGRITTCR